MMYVRAEREGDWPLHLLATNEMIPYFVAVSHFDYARYGLHYLRSMKKLPEPIFSKFMEGAHIMRPQVRMEYGRTCILKRPSWATASDRRAS